MGAFNFSPAASSRICLASATALRMALPEVSRDKLLAVTPSLGDLGRIGRNHPDAGQRQVQLFGPDHGHGGLDILAEFSLTGKNGNRLIRIDAHPGVQVRRMHQGAGQAVGRIRTFRS